VVIIGANDVTHAVRPSDAVRQLDAAVRRLRAAGSAVVVGTCPDLGAIQPILPPLRQIARAMARRMAAAQTITVVEAGGVAVSLGELPQLTQVLLPLPHELFGADRFHPSVTGYASMVAALLPLLPTRWASGTARTMTSPTPCSPSAGPRSRRRRCLGTEVSSTQLGGQERGPRGSWARVRHRRAATAPTSLPSGDDPDSEPVDA
jgi:hypothetical protein